MDKLTRIVVIGASAGGHAAIKHLVKGLNPGLNAVYLAVIHSVLNQPSHFVSALGKSGKLKVLTPKKDEKLEAGKFYISTSDNHLIISNGKICLSKGPRENLFRPSIDVLFRTAAVSYSNRVIGVLLSGRLSDGVAGLAAIKQCGGVSIIQDPESAEFNDMPLIAKQSVEIDHALPIEKIPTLIARICNGPLPPLKQVPGSLKREAAISEKIRSQIKTEQSLGEQVPLSCAQCGGPLWQIDDSSGIKRFRCHVGHAFSMDSLLESQNEKLEETLWVSLRTFEEKKLLLMRMAKDFEEKGSFYMSKSYRNKIKEVSEHISRLRNLMKLHD